MRPPLRWYAELPGRRLRQVVTDLLVLGWVVLWVAIGMLVHARATSRGEGARRLETAGTDFSRSMTEAGGTLRRLPVVGEDVQQPFDRASSAGGALAQAGRDIQAGLDQLGQILGVLIAALPIALVVAFWLQARMRYARQVRLARAIEGYQGAEINAIRSLLGLDHATLGLRSPGTAAASTPAGGMQTGAAPAPPRSAPGTGGVPTAGPDSDTISMPAQPSDDDLAETPPAGTPAVRPPER